MNEAVTVMPRLQEVSVPLNLENRNKYEPIQLPGSVKLNLSSAIHDMAGLAAGSMLTNVYTFTLPAGGDLSNVMQFTAGGQGTAVFGPDGKIMGHGAYHPAGSQGAVFMAFQTVSLVTSQYFLAEIARDMEMINRQLTDILDFLYGEKKPSCFQRSVSSSMPTAILSQL